MNIPYFEIKAGIGQATASLITGFAAFHALSTHRQDAVGGMFWFTRKRFLGSYFAFTDARRLKLSP